MFFEGFLKHSSSLGAEERLNSFNHPRFKEIKSLGKVSFFKETIRKTGHQDTKFRRSRASADPNYCWKVSAYLSVVDHWIFIGKGNGARKS